MGERMKYDDLARMIDRHGGEWIRQVKMCSQCGRLNAFTSDGTNCTLKDDCDGNMRAVERYVDTHTADPLAVSKAAKRLLEHRDGLSGSRWRERNELEDIAENLQGAIND